MNADDLRNLLLKIRQDTQSQLMKTLSRRCATTDELWLRECDAAVQNGGLQVVEYLLQMFKQDIVRLVQREEELPEEPHEPEAHTAADRSPREPISAKVNVLRVGDRVKRNGDAAIYTVTRINLQDGTFEAENSAGTLRNMKDYELVEGRTPRGRVAIS